MSQSEDYLDGLLNSINKAKTDADEVQERVTSTNQKILESRKAVAPEEDFFTATGIDASALEDMKPKSSHPYLRKVLSEEDFLRQFEEELGVDDADSFISDFEQEIDEEERIFQETGQIPESENVVGALLDNISTVVSDAHKQMDEDDAASNDDTIAEETEASSADDSTDESYDDSMIGGFDLEALMNADDSEEPADSDNGLEAEEGSLDGVDLAGDEPIKLADDDEIDLSEFMTEDSTDEESDLGGLELESEESSEEDDFGFSLDDATSDVEEEPLDDSLKEFLPDEMDALDEALYGDGEEPNLSGEDDMDLENLLDGDDEDLLDIQSLLSGDEEGAAEGAEIDESAEASADAPADNGGKKGKKDKKKKEKKKKGEKTPNPFLQKLALLIFGAPDEDEIAEMEAAAATSSTVEITYDEDGNPIIPEGGAEDPKAKKKREKEEKKKAKEAAKKEKAKEKGDKKEKPKKEPKPKKEKKPKEPDNSPKIPISIIATFLVLSISIISVVMVGMTFTGLKRHMAEAKDDFAAGNYISAYEKLNGFPMDDEEVVLMRNQARTLADLQQCQDEFDTFIMYKQYNYALDSLIKGVGRYDKYKDNAVEYGISEQYDAYGEKLIQELADNFGLTAEQALEIYKQPNRHYYTIELRKVLRGLGLPDL
ncbi:MAG: hypothetical protein E7275_08515 [Pseudobutyrivibrio sp.]|jgi:hypothetical protein|uniref:hypothetical protein n=1 Tax=Pseudobutyrivibrio sp. TaxID=2014367 RepID=UPI002600D317|nr:hypothetical protein [Pseudobutyrivibrio sp.]MBE5904317.1 hypothetical protein [Pseudobutyrivibrio sp.]